MKTSLLSNNYTQLGDQLFHQQLNQSILVKDFTYKSIRARTDDFKAINQTMSNCQYIEFDYHKVSDSAPDSSNKHHHLAPYHLLNKNGIWYVVGHWNEQMRTFFFIQIDNLQVATETFERCETVKVEIIDTDSLLFGSQIR